MKQVSFRFYEELNDYLPGEKRKVWFDYFFLGKISVMEALQTMDIPPEEIDLILVNQQSKGFDYLLQDGDQISVFPTFELIDISEINQLREKPLRKPRFICDVHLGKLCKYLRMLGWDTLYSSQYTPQELIDLSRQGKRIILTRSYRLTRHKDVTHAYWIRSANPLEQIRDLTDNLNLSARADPLSRCLLCNGRLGPVEKQEIIHMLQARTAKYYTEFLRCQACGQIYWKGSHFENMLEFIHQQLRND